MKKLLLSTVAVLGVAASIFGGYYFYSREVFQAATASEVTPSKTPESTDRNVALQIRGGALRDENGNIDPNGLKNAIVQRDLYLAEHMPPDGFGDKGVATGVPSNWLPRGPQNLGGRTEALLLHPAFGSPNADRYSNIMWAGGASGGIWTSYNSGETWNAVNGVLGNYNVSCLALDPGDPTRKTLYAGTGALDRDGDGIYRSINGGMDWQPLHGQDQGWKYVSSISVARINDNTVILAAVDNKSTTSAADHGIMRGVITASGVETWERVINAPYGAAVAFDPNNSLKVVASVCYNGDSDDIDGSCKAYYSIDGGQNWNHSQLTLTATPYPCAIPTSFETCRANDSIHFAFRKSASSSQPSEIYAQFSDGRPTVTSKSINGGMSFSALSIGHTQGISRGVPTLWISPELDPEQVTLPVIVSGGAHLFRSKNGQPFETQQIANGDTLEYNPVNPHVDMQIAVTDPRGGTNKKVFLATDGGIFHTDDIGVTTGRSDPNVTPGREQGQACDSAIFWVKSDKISG